MKPDDFIKNLTLFYVFAIGMIIFGIFGLGLGIYVQFLRESSPQELALNMSFFLFSIVFICSGIIHLSSFGTIKKINSKTK